MDRTQTEGKAGGCCWGAGGALRRWQEEVRRNVSVESSGRLSAAPRQFLDACSQNHFESITNRYAQDMIDASKCGSPTRHLATILIVRASTEGH